MQAPPRTYGEGFSSGFARFQQSQEFWDVSVVTASGEWKLHSLLLASRSEFFYRALAGQFTESETKRIDLHLEKAPGEEVWPLLVDYFYRDSITISQDNVCALLALSRQLLVTPVSTYCTQYVAEHLSTHNCIHYLRQADMYHIHDIQQQAVALAAQGFHLLYDSDVSGLPASTIMEVLRHEDLLVHCEQQVMRFVSRYLASTEVEQQDVEDISQQVRILYLDNKLLASLRHNPQLPKELLLSGSLLRLDAMDSPGAAAGLEPPPRTTYCCDDKYGLPGGSTTLTVQLEDIWQHVAPLCGVSVSGVSEGVPAHVLSANPEAWFETDESADPLPWIQVVLPTNIRMVHFNRYTYSHGHRRSGYFRLRNWQTLTSASEGGPFNKINARPNVNEPYEVNVARQDQGTPWRSIKLVGTDRQEDAVFRLCVRNLRLYGRAEVDLMRQGEPQALELTRQLVDQIKAAQASAAAAAAAANSSSWPPAAAAAAARPGSAARGNALDRQPSNNGNALPAAAAAAGPGLAAGGPGGFAAAAMAAVQGGVRPAADHMAAAAAAAVGAPMAHGPRFGVGGLVQHPGVMV